MTRKELLETIKLQTDPVFLIEILKTTLSKVPKNYASTIVHKYYVDNIYTGTVYTIRHLKRDEEYSFTSPEEIYEFLKGTMPTLTLRGVKQLCSIGSYRDPYVFGKKEKV